MEPFLVPLDAGRVINELTGFPPVRKYAQERPPEDFDFGREASPLHHPVPQRARVEGASDGRAAARRIDCLRVVAEKGKKGEVHVCTVIWRRRACKDYCVGKLLSGGIEGCNFYTVGGVEMSRVEAELVS